jgi:hypothetical protein
VTKPKLHGGVIVAYERHTHAVVQLLTYRLRQRIGITYYEHPNEIEPEKGHHFMIVLNADDLQRVVMVYEHKGYLPPLIVYIDEPHILAALNLAARFPSVEIVTIPQSTITDSPEDTLKITLFREIIEHLEACAGD